MIEQFVPYDIALKLKELGFNEPCLATFHKEMHTIIPIYAKYTNQDAIKAPLWQQALDWFRVKYQIHLEFVYSQDHNKYSWSGWDEYHARELRKWPRVDGRFPYPYKTRFQEHYWNYATYQEVRKLAIVKTIELIEKWNKTQTKIVG